MKNGMLSQINTYCYMVQRGKPCAMMSIQDRYIKNAIKLIVKEFKLKIYLEDLSEGWKTLWICKDDFMIEIIKELPEQPKTAYDHWILGKVFGYSDESIKDFIVTKVLCK